MMGVRWSLPEANKTENAPSITLAQMEELIMAARMAQAPDDAMLKVDVMVEIASPIRVHRALFDWER